MLGFKSKWKHKQRTRALPRGKGLMPNLFLMIASERKDGTKSAKNHADAIQHGFLFVFVDEEEKYYLLRI